MRFRTGRVEYLCERFLIFLFQFIILIPVWIYRGVFNRHPESEEEEFEEIQLRSSIRIPEPESFGINEEEVEEEFIPDYRQFFSLADDMGIGVERVEFCPDETVILRVVGDETFSKPFKRRVYYDGFKKRYFKINGGNFFLDDKRTQPEQPEQEKRRGTK